jgi:hypothetical protein
MPGDYYGRILTSMTVALILAAPRGALAQDSNEPTATFNERFPAAQTTTEQPFTTPEAQKEQNERAGVSRARNARRRESLSGRGHSSMPEPRCGRVSASSSITPFHRPMLHWTWSPIPAGAWAGTILHCRVHSFLGRDAPQAWLGRR